MVSAYLLKLLTLLTLERVRRALPYFVFDYLDILFSFFYIQPVPNQVPITFFQSMKKQMMESVKIFREDGAENGGREKASGHQGV
jgi:hypothetical protein